MNNIKKIIFPLFSCFLAYNTVKVVSVFYQLEPDQFSPVAKVISALAITIMTTGVVAFLGFVFPTHTLLPNRYYIVENPDNINWVYRLLGVEHFRWVLLRTFYRQKENKKYFKGTKSGLEHFEYNTRQSEFGHIAAFIFVLIISVALLVERYTAVFVWMGIFNMVLNFYPIILQRKHRITIQRLKSRYTNQSNVRIP